MAIGNADRVQETTSTTGTGSYSLNGAATGFRTFVAGIGNGVKCTYCATNGTDWETGVGTVASGSPDTLARTTVIASSNGGSAVNWGAGTKDIYVCALATRPAILLSDMDGDTKIQVEESADEDTIRFDINGTERVVMAGAQVFIGDTSNAIPLGAALTINGGTGNTYEVFALKSGDVAHGMTEMTETDTYLSVGKLSTNDGGAWFRSWSEGTQPFQVEATATTGDTTHTSAGVAPIVLIGSKKSGANRATLGTNENIVAFQTGGFTRFIVDAEGDVFWDGTSAAFDRHDDAALCRAADLVLADRKSLVDGRWDRFIAANHARLADLGLIGRTTAAQRRRGIRPLVNGSAFVRLHNGAIWQAEAKFRALVAVLDDMTPGLGERLAARFAADRLPPLPIAA